MADKQKAADEIGKLVPLEQLTADINSGKVNVTELAFAVEGQISGVEHERQCAEKTRHAACAWTKYAAPCIIRHAEEPSQAQSHGDALHGRWCGYSSRAGRSFVERLGRPKLDSRHGLCRAAEQPQRAERAGRLR